MFVGTDGIDHALARLIDRKVVLSYKTLLFLKFHGFRLEDSFDKGVPYLSREEKNEAASQFLDDDRNQAREAVDVASQDTRTQTFYNEARDKILRWSKNPNSVCQGGDQINAQISANSHIA